MNLLVKNDDVCCDSVGNDCDVIVDSIFVFSMAMAMAIPRPSDLWFSSASLDMPATIGSWSAVLDALLIVLHCASVAHRQFVDSIDFPQLKKSQSKNKPKLRSKELQRQSKVKCK